MGTQSHYPVSLPSFAELLLSVDFPSVRPQALPGDPSPTTTSHIKNLTRGRRKKIKDSHGQGESHGHATAIGVLPDNVLLEIFDLCQINQGPLCLVWKWHLLVHVCRRWRQIIFESPRRLNLQILCTHGTPARKNLDIWPPFPIVIDYRYFGRGITPKDEDNIISALEHEDRVCFVRLDVTGSQLGQMATVMRETFPVLTRLDLSSDDRNVTVLPAEFLGGSAPCLQAIYLRGIPFPALPTLLLSTSDLVVLNLIDIPPTGYVSPRAMVVGLAALPRLKIFDIDFQSATSRPDRIPPPPLTRAILPSLTSFRFRGASEYLEDLVAQIDAPQLQRIFIDYLNQLVDYQVAQLPKFIDRSVGLKSTVFRHGRVIFNQDSVTFAIQMESPTSSSSSYRCMNTTIRCEGLDWQVSHIAQVLGHLSATISTVVHLELQIQSCVILGGGDDAEWLDLLHAISTVQTLLVSRELTGHVALALQGITGETASKVLPSLDLICLDNSPAPSIEKFVNARKLCGRPITAVGATEFYKRLRSHVRK